MEFWVVPLVLCCGTVAWILAPVVFVISAGLIIVIIQSGSEREGRPLPDWWTEENR
jgi:hypothetical protein